jgi:hypothetical protein
VHMNWDLNFGELLIAVGLLVSFLGAHAQNIRRMERIETKLDTIYVWWQSHINGSVR